MFCRNCGKKLDDNALFCRECGQRVKKNNSAPVRQAESFDEKPYIKLQKEPYKESYKEPQRETHKEPHQKRKGIGTTIVSVLLLTVIITVGAAFITYKIKMKNADSSIRQEQLEAKNEEHSDNGETAEGEQPQEESIEEPTEAPTETGVEENKIVEMETVEKKEEDKSGVVNPENSVTVNQVQEIVVQQPPVQQPEVSPYILPQSNQVYLSDADVADLDIKQVNYAKNEIFARHGRKFFSSELQNYFNSQSWYNGTIDPVTFDQNQESILSSMEYTNAVFLATVEHNMDPEGYVLDR